MHDCRRGYDESSLVQEGAGNGLTVRQNGGGNSLSFVQSGPGLAGTVEQSGGRTLQVLQNGTMPVFISQDGAPVAAATGPAGP